VTEQPWCYASRSEIPIPPPKPRPTRSGLSHGDAVLNVSLPESLTPEALETVLTRSRREFVAGARQLGVTADEAEDSPRVEGSSQ